ncbi:tetratricopeptide repeat protein [Bremerella cremea]|uniref:tetratricopeptide repeat protein n=1 Tax=Bremerella cremea TaxID=1031537 RepID=UPI0031ED75DD
MKPPFHKHLLITVLALAATWSPMAFAEDAAEQYRVGSFHYSRGDWSQAVDSFDRFLVDHPDHERIGLIHFYRGESLIQLNRHDEALRAYTLFLSKAPGHSFAEHAEFRVAECYALNNQLDAAKNAFEIFQSKHKGSKLTPHIYPYLAEIAAKQKNWDEAVLMYNKSVKLAASPATTAESRLGLARAYGESNRWKEAGLTYEQLLIDLKELPGKYPAGSIALEAGIAEFKAGSYRRAVARFELAATQDPKLNDQTSFWIAKTYYQVRDWPNALDRLTSLKTTQALPDFQDEIHYLIAKIAIEQGNASQAVAVLQDQLETWPNSTWTDEALYQLLNIRLQQDNLDQAEKTWNRLAKCTPATALTVRAQLALVSALQQKDEHQKALQVLAVTFPELDGEASQADRYVYLKAVSLFALKQTEEAKQLIVDTAADRHGNYRGMSLMLLGMIHSQNEDWGSTVAALNGAIEEISTSEHRTIAQLRSTNALLHCDRIADAKQAWSQVDRSRLSVDNYLTEVSHIAGTAYRKGEIAWAESLYQEMAQGDNPERFIEQGLAGLAWCQLATADPDAANKTLDELMEKNPGSPLAVGALFQQAQQLEATDVDLAMTRYRQLAEHHPKDPLAAHARLRCATILDQLSRDSEAEVILVDMAKNPPAGLAAEDLWYRLAWVRLDQKKEKEALEAFQQIHQRFLDGAIWEDSTYRLAEAALKAGKLDQARKYLQKLLEVNSESKVAMFGRYMLGQVEVQSGNWEAAIPQMDQVADSISDEPLHSMAMFWGGEARFRSEKFADAQKRFEQMLTENMGRPLETLPVAEMRLAQIQAHQGNWDLAYERAVEIGKNYPQFSQVHELEYLMGRCLARQGKFQEARAAYNKVCQSNVAGQSETAAMAQWMIGETYFHQKNYDAAIRAYAKVATHYENFSKWQAAALLQIGKCHEVQEDWEKASQYYTEVRTDYEATPFAPEAELRLSVVRQRTQQAQVEGTTRTK